MKMPHGDASLWELIVSGGNLEDRFFRGLERDVPLSGLVDRTSLDCDIAAFADRSVLVATADQLTAALALVELDGVVSRLVLCPPDVSVEHFPHIIATADIDIVVADAAMTRAGFPGSVQLVRCGADLTPSSPRRDSRRETEWVLMTSGTTGVPKLVAHTLASLAGATKSGGGPADPHAVWSTFYDIRRYGGLQIFLRGTLGGGSLVLSSIREPVADFLARVGRCGVTHISGTPSHWRRALMSPAAGRIAPKYVRLSGEISDQAILDDLKNFYRDANVAHAFASTEAGVAFDVRDGLAGFPVGLIGQRNGDVEMKIDDGSLRIRSNRTASRYLGDAGPLRDLERFVDTGDILEQRGDRFYFVGRRGGIINVGGLKVHPEEIEAVINRHPAVQMSLVKARKNPFTGAVVVADVVARPDTIDESNKDIANPASAFQNDIIAACREALPPHKVPASIRLVPSLNVGAAGKLARVGA